jgi:hypothetical protein
VAFDNMQKRPIKGTTGWTQYAVVLDVPSDASQIAFGVLLDGKGTVWADEFVFDKVGTGVATTDLMSAQSAGKVSNLDFERGPAGKCPEGWFEAGERPTNFEMVTVHGGYSGRQAAMVRARGKPLGFGTLMQTATAEHFRGKRIRMSGWMRTENVSDGWAGLWLRVDDKSGNSSAFDNMYERSIKGTTPWTRYDIVLDVGADATIIAFGTLLTGQGAAFVDDFTFEVVDRSVPVTDVMKRPKLAETPINLDFEE